MDILVAVIVWITGCLLWMPVFFRHAYGSGIRGLFRRMPRLEGIQLIRLVVGITICMGSSRWVLLDVNLVTGNSWIATELVSLGLRIVLVILSLAVVLLIRSRLVSGTISSGR